MPAAFTIAQAQKKLLSIIRDSRQRPVPITKNKQIVGFFHFCERMESMLETMEIMQDKKAMKAIRNYEAGKTKFQPLSALDDHQG